MLKYLSKYKENMAHRFETVKNPGIYAPSVRKTALLMTIYLRSVTLFNLRIDGF